LLDVLVLDVLLCELSKVFGQTLLFKQRVRVGRHVKKIIDDARAIDELVRDADLKQFHCGILLRLSS
jgi:hypothetical protein